VLDIVLLAYLPTLAAALHADSATPIQQGYALAGLTAFALAVKIPTFHFFGLYNRYWRYASVGEGARVGVAVATAMLVLAGLFFGAQRLGVLPQPHIPIAVLIMDGLLTFMVVGMTRFSLRLAEYRWGRSAGQNRGRRRVIIIGASDTGAAIAREIQSVKGNHLEPVGFVDDNPQKLGMRIHNLPVLGPPAKLSELIRDYGIQEAIIALPSPAGRQIREIVRLCDAAEVSSKIVPGMHEVLSGHVSVNHLRQVNINDLLHREMAPLDEAAVYGMIAGKRVLVTGAGGSIGRELCWQIAHHDPAQLIVIGHGENSLFTLTNELSPLRKYVREHPHIHLKAIIADVRDRFRLQNIFSRYQPQIVFHAAAHKHVPLMEDNIEDAVSNNVLGTRLLVELSEAHGVERFVLISSDKAVNPFSVMGATKRIAELIVHGVAERSGRPYVSVRFGNVLGSRGSAVPLFLEQIAAGGPVTVTHPEVKRYFMTIHEAVRLVLQAATLGKGQEVFILDMGEPIRLVDLARDLIALAGYQAGRDIDIVFTGLRPGEKLFEELVFDSEHYTRTRHAQIFVVRDGTGHLLFSELEDRVNRLVEAAERGQPEEVRRWLTVLVPQYNPAALAPGANPVAVAPIRSATLATEGGAHG
jgi:FlaA1/EpsC-like NDP-sugar epimerase